MSDEEIRELKRRVESLEAIVIDLKERVESMGTDVDIIRETMCELDSTSLKREY